MFTTLGAITCYHILAANIILGFGVGQAAVLGFVGSPWTLATYVIEGSSSGLYKTIKTMIHGNPDLLSALLSHLAEQIATYSCYQIRSGAQCIQLFDSWGGQLPPQVSIVCLEQCVNRRIHCSNFGYVGWHYDRNA